MRYLFDEFKFLDGRNLDIDPRIQYDAARSGNLDVLKYIFDKYEASKRALFPIDANIQFNAARSGNLDVLRYLIDEKGVAIDYQQIKFGLRWARSSDPNYVTKVLKYLREEKGVRDI